MDVGYPGSPRARGRRIAFGQVPDAVHDWVVVEFGEAAVVSEHVGGMSPGCATTLSTSRRGLVFVKSVGVELNPNTANLFRREIATMSCLPEVSYRPALVGTYDDGEWVGLALEHVPGLYPDFASSTDVAAVARTIEMQTDELTPAPSALDVPSLADSAARWCERWSDVCAAPGQFLPSWAARRAEELFERVVRLTSSLSDESLCHFDIRDDNILIRPDGEAVVLDWGMARRGPSWTDQVLLAAQLPTPVEADVWLQQHCPAHVQETVTTFLIAYAGSQAWNSRQPPPPSLPAFPSFTRDDARRLFAIARERLSG